MTAPAVPTHAAWAQTHSGLPFDFLNPTAAHIRDADVAHHLAHINRFTGGLGRAYSVAQHGLLVVELLAERGHADAGILLQGLVHDSPEYVLGDVSAPLKRLLPDYQKVEARVWAACAEHYGVPVVLDTAVKLADSHACRLEAHAFYPGGPLDGWTGATPVTGLGRDARNVLFLRLEPFTWTRRWQVTLEFLRDAAAVGQTVNLRTLSDRGWR